MLYCSFYISCTFLLLRFIVTFCAGQLVVASLLNRNIKARLLLRNAEKATALFGEQDKEKLEVLFQIVSVLLVMNMLSYGRLHLSPLCFIFLKNYFTLSFYFMTRIKS